MLDFAWAGNKLKLARAVEFVKNANRADASIEISEENIKARYILLAGNVLSPDTVESLPAVAKKIRNKKG